MSLNSNVLNNSVGLYKPFGSNSEKTLFEKQILEQEKQFVDLILLLDKGVGYLISAERLFISGGHSLNGVALAKSNFDRCYMELEKSANSLKSILQLYRENGPKTVRNYVPIEYSLENIPQLGPMMGPIAPIPTFITPQPFIGPQPYGALQNQFSFGFVTDGEKFLRAYNSILQSMELLEKSRMTVYDCVFAKEALSDCYKCVSNAYSQINELMKIVQETRDRLRKLDSEFEKQYKENEKKIAEAFPNLETYTYQIEDFKEGTDLQYNQFGMLSYHFGQNVGLYQELAKNKRKLGDIRNQTCREDFENHGFSNFTVEEVITDEYGCKILILKDEVGNYTMVFPPTQAPTNDPLANDPANYDTWYDAYPLLEEMGLVDFWTKYRGDIKTFLDKAIGVNYLTGSFTDNHQEYQTYSDLMSMLFNSKDNNDLIYAAREIYYGQRATVESVAQKYAKRALEEGKQINFFGYSKGGGLAELAYLTAYNNSSRAKHDILGRIIVYNPFHDNLTSDEVEILENSGDLTVYRNQGDYVSCLFNERDFVDQTIFIKCNWRNSYNEEIKGQNGLYSCLKFLGDIYILPDNIEDVVSIIANAFKLSSVLENGSPHSLQVPLEAGAFKDDGTAIKSEKYDSKEVSKVLFGNSITTTDIMSNIKNITVNPLVGGLVKNRALHDVGIIGKELWDVGCVIYEEAEKVFNFCVDRVEDAIEFMGEALCDFGDWISFWN